MLLTFNNSYVCLHYNLILFLDALTCLREYWCKINYLPKLVFDMRAAYLLDV